MHFEAAELARCITAVGAESPPRPLADSVATLGIMDEIRLDGDVSDTKRMPQQII